MAFTTLSGGRAPSAATRLARRAADALRERRAYNAAFRQTYRELHALNDRELADLGFVRGEIGGLAREAAERAIAGR
jgi:uncharacterized protein YjiS (DUF1127 family)